MPQIHPATIQDLHTLISFNKKLSKKEHQDFDTTINPEFADTERGQKYFRNCIESDTTIALIAKENEVPIGYLVGGIEAVSEYRTIGRMCEIDNMWVDEAHRDKGIGKLLMEEAKQWAKDKGITRMRVIASFDNTKAIDFYKREGFEEYDLILEQDI